MADTSLVSVSFDAEGFMKNPNQWSKEIAEMLAKQEGLAALTADHWKISDFCRQTGLASGKAPTLRQITGGTGISTKELFALYPKGPAKKVARIAGLGKPEGCV